MKPTIKRHGLGLVAMIFASVAQCGLAMSAGDSTPPQYGGTLTMALHADTNSLDPAKAPGFANYYISNIVYDSLLTLTENGSLGPGLATSWTTQGRSINLKLRNDVVFHDGTPFNAQAVKYNIDRTLRGRSAASLSAVESVAVNGDFEVTITLKENDAAFLPTLIELARQAGSMVSPTAAEKEGDSFGLNPVGTGPFSFVSWTRDQEIVFQKNPKYWRKGEPYLDKVVLRPIPDEGTRTNQLRSGRLDVIYQVQPKDLLLLERDRDIKVVKRPSNGWDVVFLNTEAGILKDANVRRALNLAVNRQAIIDGLFQSSGTPGQGPLTPSHPGYQKDFHPNPSKGDLDEAKALLAKAGVKEGTTIRLGTPLITRFEQITQAIQQDWRKIGIEAKIERFETPAGLQQLSVGNYEAIVWYYSGHPDLDGVTSTIFSSQGVNNYWVRGYKNPQVEALLQKGRVESDPAKRVGYYQEAEKLIVQDSPALIIRYYEDIYAYRANVHGLTHRADSILNLGGVWKSQ